MAYSAIVLFIVTLFISVRLEIWIACPLLAGLALSAVMACKQGAQFSTVARQGFDGARNSFAVVETLFYVGALTAAWRESGTIAYLVYHGLLFLSPSVLLPGSFVLSTLLSMLIGTSIGTISVLGIPIMIIASSSGMGTPMLAGAIIAGAYVGDRGSPLSSSAQLVASATGTSAETNMRRNLRDALPVIVACGIAYALLSWFMPPITPHTDLAAQLGEVFNLAPSTLIPALVVLCGPALKIRSRYIFLCSTLAALILASVVQGIAPARALHSIVWGYEIHGAGPLARLFAGGGICSMAAPIIIVLLSASAVEILIRSNFLLRTEQRIALLFPRLGAYMTNSVVSLVASAITCNQTLTVLFAAKIQQKFYRSAEDRTAFAQMISNTAILLPVLIPWNVALTLPLSILGATTASIPFIFFPILMPLLGWRRIPRVSPPNQ
jgi:Na+/H+ antiporter